MPSGEKNLFPIRRPAWKDGEQRGIAKLKTLAAINATAPEHSLGDSHVSDPLAIRGEVDMVYGNSGKERQKLLGAGVVTYQFTTRLKTGDKYLAPVLTG